jgi:hypothetical protein
MMTLHCLERAGSVSRRLDGSCRTSSLDREPVRAHEEPRLLGDNYVLGDCPATSKFSAGVLAPIQPELACKDVEPRFFPEGYTVGV